MKHHEICSPTPSKNIFFFWGGPGAALCGMWDLMFSWPATEPVPPAMEVWILDPGLQQGSPRNLLNMGWSETISQDNDKF